MKKLYLFLNVIMVLFIIFFNCEQTGGKSGGGGKGGGGGGGGTSSACIHAVDESVMAISIDFGERTLYYAEYNELCNPSLCAKLIPDSMIEVEYGEGFAQITPELIQYPFNLFIIIPSTVVESYTIEDGALVCYEPLDGSMKRFVNFRDDDHITLWSNGSTEDYPPNYVVVTFNGSLRAPLSSGDYEYMFIDVVFDAKIINP